MLYTEQDPLKPPPIPKFLPSPTAHQVVNVNCFLVERLDLPLGWHCQRHVGRGFRRSKQAEAVTRHQDELSHACRTSDDGADGAPDRRTPRCYGCAGLECPQPRSPFQVIDRHVQASGNGRMVQKWVPFRGWEKQALPSCLLLNNCSYIRSLI